MAMPEIECHLSESELNQGLGTILAAPKDFGPLELIVRRPETNKREILDSVHLDSGLGMEGDNWHKRPSSMTPDRSPHRGTQLTLMSSRAASLVARTRDRWPLAGDQLYADLDLSEANLPAGTRLVLGTALIEVSSIPHLGCAKFVDRFGAPAMKFVNSPQGKALRLRGVNLTIVRSGVVKMGDLIRKAGPSDNT